MEEANNFIENTEEKKVIEEDIADYNKNNPDSEMRQ